MVRIRTAKDVLVMDWKAGYPGWVLGILNAEKIVKFEADGAELETILHALQGTACSVWT